MSRILGFLTHFHNHRICNQAIWYKLTCEIRQSSLGKPRCGCQKGKGCLPPCTARTQILWPDISIHTHNYSKVIRQLLLNGKAFVNVYELTSQSNLMCLANVVWISVREQLRRPLEISIKSWSEYISSFSTKCWRSCSFRKGIQ